MKTKKRASKPAPAVHPEPKPQIPAMLQALRRQREQYRTLVEALAAKLAPILRPATDVVGAAVETVSDAAPVAQALSETVSIFAAVNAQLRDITSRVEL